MQKRAYVQVFTDGDGLALAAVSSGSIRWPGTRGAISVWAWVASNTMKRLLIAVAVAAMSTIILAVPAQADEDSFIDYMRSHGQTVLPGGEGSWIAGGFQICDRIRAAGPEAGLKLVTPMPGRDPATYVYAAQHELCPDTVS